MPFWEQAISMLREAMFGYAQLTQGSLGTGILVISFVARALLLPLTVKLGVAAARHQAAVARLKPELDALREQHQGDPEALHSGMRELFAREGVSMFPLSTLVGSLVQWPLLFALFSAVQQVATRGGAFLWIRDLARPDIGVAVVATGLTIGGALLGPQPPAEQRWAMVLIPALVTAITLTHVASGIGLYWGASSVVGIIQAVLVARRRAA